MRSSRPSASPAGARGASHGVRAGHPALSVTDLRWSPRAGPGAAVLGGQSEAGLQGSSRWTLRRSVPWFAHARTSSRPGEMDEGHAALRFCRPRHGSCRSCLFAPGWAARYTTVLEAGELQTVTSPYPWRRVRRTADRHAGTALDAAFARGSQPRQYLHRYRPYFDDLFLMAAERLFCRWASSPPVKSVPPPGACLIAG